MLLASELRKSYGGNAVLDGLSLHLQAGELLGLVGINGSGKSTLLHIFCGLIAPNSGSVALMGENPSFASNAALAKMAFVGQGLHLLNQMSAERYIRYVGSLYPPTMLRDRQLRRHLVLRVLNDALVLLQTAVPLIIVALVAFAQKPLLSWITAGGVVLGFAGFAVTYPALVALIYMRYRFIEAGLWLTAMLTSSALVIMVLMPLGRWLVTPIWLGFVLCALILCVDCIRFRPIRLVHFLTAEQLRPSRFN